MGEKNYGKSVRAKLLNISKAEKLGYQLIVIRYIQERLLYRLSQSRFREKLFLKGGALLYAHEQFRARPTLDIDFLGDKISRDKEFVKMAFEEICAVSCPEDGVTFDTESISAEEITVNKEYHGIRLHVTARLDTIRQVISMDIGFGDVILHFDPRQIGDKRRQIPQNQGFAGFSFLFLRHPKDTKKPRFDKVALLKPLLKRLWNFSNDLRRKSLICRILS